jgi:hypothetical protein
MGMENQSVATAMEDKYLDVHAGYIPHHVKLIVDNGQ